VNREQWRHVDQLLQSALELEEPQRERFVRQACRGDEMLERETMSLLKAYGEARDFLEVPAADPLQRLGPIQPDDEEGADLLLGRRISHYQVIERLGGGGMGVVYKAEDTRLNRFVALKFLGQWVLEDPVALSRFESEARAASSLNHPHICTVHDVGHEYGQAFIVMEYLSGQTLKHRISVAPIEIETLSELAIGICDGLGAAHAQGIVHRDIKPANIFLTQRGEIKILDFGLAKTVAAGAGERDMRSSTNNSWQGHDGLTGTGAAFGTAHYMSPEQVVGRVLDARSDLFSLGAVLYEMATGEPPFRGLTNGEVLDATLYGSPIAPRQLDPKLPVKVERLILKCLEKDPEQRYQSVSEVRGELEGLRRAADRSNRVRRLAPYAFGTGAVLFVAFAAYWLGRPLPPPQVSNYVRISNDDRAKGTQLGAVVTDGSFLYLAEGSGGAPVLARIPVSGGETALLLSPFGMPEVQGVSRNASELLVTDFSHKLGRPLWAWKLSTGTPRRIGQVLATTAASSPDGRELAFIRNRELYRTDAEGGNERRIADLPGSAFWLRWSPDGKRLRFTVGNVIDRDGALSIWDIGSDGTGLHPLFPDWNQPPQECCGNWSPDGKYYVFQSTRNGNTEIWAVREGDRLLRWGGRRRDPTQVTSGQLNSLLPVFSPDGKKLYVIGQKLRGQLVRYERQSHEWVPYLSGISAEYVTFPRTGTGSPTLTFRVAVSGAAGAMARNG